MIDYIINTINYWFFFASDYFIVFENKAIIVLTAFAILFAAYVGIKCIAMAMALDSGCIWVCRTVGRMTVNHVLYSMAMVCVLLVVLKTWSIVDSILIYWYDMPGMYRFRAFAFLTENFATPISFLMVIRMIKSMTKCDTARKIKHDKAKFIDINYKEDFDKK